MSACLAVSHLPLAVVLLVGSRVIWLSSVLPYAVCMLSLCPHEADAMLTPMSAVLLATSVGMASYLASWLSLSVLTMALYTVACTSVRDLVVMGLLVDIHMVVTCLSLAVSGVADGAFLYFVVSALGSLVWWGSVILLAVTAGESSIQAVSWLIAVLLMAAVLIKGGAWPIYIVVPSVASVLGWSGCMVFLVAAKVVYAVVVVRLTSLLVLDPHAQVLGLSIIGVAMVGSGLMLAFEALDLRRWYGGSSVSSAGLVLVGVASQEMQGHGWLWDLVASHALSAGSVFHGLAGLNVGWHARCDVFSLGPCRGSWLGPAAALHGVTLLTSIGMPPSIGFGLKVVVLLGLCSASCLVCWLAVVSLVLAAVCHYVRLVTGQVSLDFDAQLTGLTATHRVGSAVCGTPVFRSAVCGTPV